MPYPTKQSPQQMQQNLGTMKADIHHLAPRGCTCVKPSTDLWKMGARTRQHPVSDALRTKRPPATLSDLNRRTCDHSCHGSRLPKRGRNCERKGFRETLVDKKC